MKSILWNKMGICTFKTSKWDIACAPVLPLRFLSLGQFYKISQNWEVLVAKLQLQGWKWAQLARKKHLYTFSQNLLSKFYKVLGQFCNMYGLSSNTVVFLLHQKWEKNTYQHFSLCCNTYHTSPRSPAILGFVERHCSYDSAQYSGFHQGSVYDYGFEFVCLLHSWECLAHL